MKLKQFKKIIDECVVRAEHTDPDVTVWFKKAEYEIRGMGQYSVIPDVTITIGKKLWEEEDLYED